MKQAQNNSHRYSNNLDLLPRLFEGFEYKDLVGMLKSTVHIDEFSSKMGDDDDVIVASFFVRSKQAADDLAAWFEKGYEWILDADTSPGEVKPGRYLVYIEIRRRSQAGKHIAEVLTDLGTLTEFNDSDWVMHYKDKDYPFSTEEFDKIIPLSPKAYRATHESDLNGMRSAAGIDEKQIYEREADIRQLQAAAGQI
jgi:hypothetical protein